MRKTFTRNFRRFAQFELNGELRRAMRRETEMLFEHILRKDRSLLELLDSDYTFLNERLARHYGIPGVVGTTFRKVTLPDNARAGLLGQGSILTVTAYNDRTSVVVRGVGEDAFDVSRPRPGEPQGRSGVLHKAAALWPRRDDRESTDAVGKRRDRAANLSRGGRNSRRLV